MDFPDPLIPGRLIKRYKRFLADVEITAPDGSIREITAHCPNPGAMTGLSEPDSDVWLSPARNSKRKLQFTWEIIRVGPQLVGINTAHPNGIAEESIRAGQIP